MKNFFHLRFRSGFPYIHIIITSPPDIDLGFHREMEGRHYEIYERLVVGTVKGQGSENGRVDHDSHYESGAVNYVP